MSTVLGLLHGFKEGATLLQEFLKQGIEYSEALSRINELGVSLIPEVSDKVFEYTVKSVIPQTKEILELPGHYLPNIASIPSSLTKLLRNFSYQVKLRGESQYGGQLEDRYISISSNKLLTKNEALEAAFGLAQENTKSGGINGATGEITSISQNAAGLTNVESIIPTSTFTSTLGFNPYAGNYVDTSKDNIVSPSSRFNTYQEQAKANRDYLRSIAQGPVVPVLFTESGQVIVSGKRVTP